MILPWLLTEVSLASTQKMQGENTSSFAMPGEANGHMSAKRNTKSSGPMVDAELHSMAFISCLIFVSHFLEMRKTALSAP